MLCLSFNTAKAFSRTLRYNNRITTKLYDAKRGINELVLVRHGESTWNELNQFTGWYDCPLSEKGKVEALAAAKLLAENGYKFDVAYTSTLKRAIRTLWYALEETDCMYIPIKNKWELNERYGVVIIVNNNTLSSYERCDIR